MQRFLDRAAPLAVLVLLAAGVRVTAQAAQDPEELARRHYELGLGFLQAQNYTEALKDFQAVVDSYPASGVAGDAMLQIASYQFEIAHDPAAARAATDVILKKYPSGEAAAAAHVLTGRLATEERRDPADVEAALASFERVAGLFPNSAAVPSSIYYAGDVLRIVRRYEEALERYRDLALRYPTSPWAARAMLGAALCLTQLGRPQTAMEGLQRVRAMHTASPEADTALRWNSILYRLYIRPPEQPPYTYSGRVLGSQNARTKDVVGVLVNSRDEILLAHSAAVSVFESTGALARSIPADDPAALFLTPAGAAVVVREGTFQPESSAAVSLSAPGPDGKLRAVTDVPSAVATSKGDWLVSDKKDKTILQFAPDGKYLKTFSANIEASRLALNALGDLAAIDRSGKAIVVFDRNGKPIGRLPARGPNYDLGNPVDLAFDPLGHLYVLDRERATVFVFGPQWKLVATFSIPEGSPGVFRRAAALGIDSAGRLYIFDDQVQHVQVYQ
jgi:TolA-binding protein